MSRSMLEAVLKDALVREQQASASAVCLENRCAAQRRRREAGRLGGAAFARSPSADTALLADADRRGLDLVRDAGAALEHLERELSVAHTQLAEQRARRRAIEHLIDCRRNKERIRRDRIEEEALQESNARTVKERYLNSP